MKLTKREILHWAYGRPDGARVGGISFVANVIDCHYGDKAKLLRGLFNAVVSGHEVRDGNTIDQVTIDGRIQSLTNLANYA